MSIIAGPGVTHKLARHMTVDRCVFPLTIYDRYLRMAVATCCCAGVLRRRAGGLRGVHKLSRHTPPASLTSFCHEGRYFSPVDEGLALCLPRHASAHHSMLPLHRQFQIWRLYVHCLCMFDVFPPGLLLSCSRSTSLDSAFLQRRARLLVMGTQKSPGT